MNLTESMYDYRADIQEINSTPRKAIGRCFHCEEKIFEGEDRYCFKEGFIHKDCIDFYYEDGLFDDINM